METTRHTTVWGGQVHVSQRDVDGPGYRGEKQ